MNRTCIDESNPFAVAKEGAAHHDARIVKEGAIHQDNRPARLTDGGTVDAGRRDSSNGTAGSLPSTRNFKPT